MDPKFISLLIQQLLNTTQCPKCGAAISPLNVQVQNINNNQCLFKMRCSKCNTIISADAQACKQPPAIPKINRTNTSFSTPKNVQQKKLQAQAKRKSAVSINDLMQIKKSTQTFPGSFKDLLI